MSSFGGRQFERKGHDDESIGSPDRPSSVDNNTDALRSSFNDEITVAGDYEQQQESEAKPTAVETPQRQSESQRFPSISAHAAPNQPALAALFNVSTAFALPRGLMAMSFAAGNHLAGSSQQALPSDGSAQTAFQNPNATVGTNLPGMFSPHLLALMMSHTGGISATTTLPVMALLAQQQLQSLSGLNHVSANLPPASVTSQTPPPLTNRSAVPLFLDYDEHTLNEYQCMLRKQIELFGKLPSLVIIVLQEIVGIGGIIYLPCC
jgi:hypothetical protein